MNASALHKANRNRRHYHSMLKNVLTGKTTMCDHNHTTIEKARRCSYRRGAPQKRKRAFTCYQRSCWEDSDAQA